MLKFVPNILLVARFGEGGGEAQFFFKISHNIKGFLAVPSHIKLCYYINQRDHINMSIFFSTPQDIYGLLKDHNVKICSQ